MLPAINTAEVTAPPLAELIAGMGVAGSVGATKARREEEERLQRELTEAKEREKAWKAR